MRQNQQNRNDEMKRLRYECGKTLEEIGDLFGVTRERVRQIVGKSGLGFVARWKFERGIGPAAEKAAREKRKLELKARNEKLCRRCGEVKSKTEFHKSSERPDGVYTYCKSCVRKWQTENKERMIANAIRWQRNHPEKQKASSKKYMENHKDRIRERARRYRRENIEKSREKTMEYRRKNVEKSRAWSRKYRMAHPEIATIKAENRRARKLYNGGKITRAEWNELKRVYGNRCLCCGKQEPEIRLTLDHVLPLVMGGKHSIENAQPLCKPCNSRKHAKHIDYRPNYKGG